MSSYGKVIGVALLLTLAAGTPASAKKAAKFNHVVVVMMENRSFDHLLGWLPGADGKQAGLEYPDDLGVMHPTAELAPDFQGCGRSDPDHSYEGGRIDLNGGQMNGFLMNTGRATGNENDDFAIGYYVEDDRPFFNSLALNYTTFDYFFSPILAETFPNRIFMHAAQTDRLTNTFTISTLTTIWDRLKAKGVSARYYRSDFSFLSLWGTKYDSITFSHEQFLTDAKNGTLPKVAFVEPRFAGEEQGSSNDDHPHADIREGDAFLAEAFHAVSSGPSWGSTIFIVTYDEWGGFFDHVAPPRATAPNDIDMDVDADGKVLLGLRIPVVVASPFTRGDPTRPLVNSTLFDNTSILKLIETRWGLTPLTARDDPSSDVGDLTSALNLTTPDRRVPALPNPAARTIPPSCPTNSSSSPNGEPGLSDLGQLRPGQ